MGRDTRTIGGLSGPSKNLARAKAPLDELIRGTGEPKKGQVYETQITLSRNYSANVTDGVQACCGAATLYRSYNRRLEFGAKPLLVC
jgi:hypothetical protein